MCAPPPASKESVSVEYRAWMQCTPQITEALALDMSRPIKISDHLFGNSLVCFNFHQQLINSPDSPCDTAQQLVDEITKCIEDNPTNFYKLENVLKEQGNWTRDIVSTLMDTLAKLDGK